MSPEELTWLAEQASQHSLIVEIGAFLGRSTRALADNTPGKVITVDDFYGPRKSTDVRPDGKAFTEEDRLTIYPEFCKFTSDLQKERKLKVFKITYDNIGRIPLIADLIPDMVFIDGDHNYEAVKRDVEFWKNRLIPGGLLCGHDFVYLPVRQAVLEILPDAQQAPHTDIWFKVI